MRRPQVHMLRQPQVLQQQLAVWLTKVAHKQMLLLTWHQRQLMQRSLRLHHKLPVPHQLRTVLLVLLQVRVQWLKALPKLPAQPLLKRMRCTVRPKLLNRLP